MSIRTISILSLSVLIGTVVNAQTANQYNQKGDAALNDNKTSEAIEWYTKAIDADKKSPVGYYNRGYTYKYLNELDKALADLGKAIELGPDSAVYYADRSDVYAMQNNSNAALADASKYIALRPNDLQGYYHRGLLFRDKNLYEKAITDFTTAISIGSYPPAYLERGVMYNRTNRDDLALADFNKAIALAPDYLQPYINKAQTISHTAGKMAEAIQVLNDAEKIAKMNTYPALYMSRGTLYMKSGKAMEAIEDFKKAAALGSTDPDCYNNKAIAEYKLKKYDDALASATKALELDPGNYTYYNTIARIYTDKGEAAKGLAEAEKGLAMAADNIELLQAKAIALYKMGRTDEALAIKARVDKMQGAQN